MPSAALKAKEKAKKAGASKPKDREAAAKAPDRPELPDQLPATTCCPDILLVLPPCLTPRQRAVLHELGESRQLHHASSGEGAARHLRFGAGHGKEGMLQVTIPTPASGALSDSELSALLLLHLHLELPQLLAPPPGSRPPAAPPLAAGGPSATPGLGGGGPARAGGAAAGAGTGPRARGVGLGAAVAGVGDVDAFVSLHLRLLELEREAEVAQTLAANSQLTPETAQARGRALLNLRVAEVEGGLLGRTLLTLVSNKGWCGGAGAGAPPPDLPPHRFGGHDVVALRPNKGTSEGPPLCTGVIYRVKDSSVVVAVEEAPEEGLDQPLRLEQLANEVTYKRLKSTLQSLAKTAAGTVSAASAAGSGGLPCGAPLLDVAFGRRPPRFVSPAPVWKPVNSGLDCSQQAAVSMALAAKDLALIHGPPGTGKTTAVVELALQEVARGSRLLLAAASNIAVDNLVERLVKAAGPKLRIVRMGHPARLLPQVLDSSLEAHVLRSDSSSLANDCRKEIRAINTQLMKLKPWQRAERRQLRGDLRRLGKEERGRQEAAVKEVVAGAQVIASTLTGLLHHHLEGQRFDLVIIDEAAQAMEAACWAGLLKAPRAVLAGDHLQLPPTVISEQAAREGLACTLFERLQGQYGEACCSMLTVQYRMHTSIMTWSSDALYEGRVTAHESVAGHTLADLPASSHEAQLPSSSQPGPGGRRKGAAPSRSAPATTAAVVPSALPVLLLIDTAGCGFEEEAEEEGDSKANPGEARAVMAHVKALVKAGVAPADIGVISAYNAQVALLRELRGDTFVGLEVSSVDGFQGREKEAIVISTVRSNAKGEIGFLADKRRMNVAVTRARRHCALVCDSETLSHDPFLHGLVQYFEERGEYASAAELVAS
ncbi:P-loop containing nucleoside triphosphate hydrolase protein [Haematococcus lacustris]